MSRAVYTGLLQFVPSSRRGEELDDDGRDPCQKASKRKQTTRNSRAALLEHVVSMHQESRLICADVPTPEKPHRGSSDILGMIFERIEERITAPAFNILTIFRRQKFHVDNCYGFSKVMSTGRYAECTLIRHERSEIFL